MGEMLGNTDVCKGKLLIYNSGYKTTQYTCVGRGVDNLWISSSSVIAVCIYSSYRCNVVVCVLLLLLQTSPLAVVGG
jgi:hypothetical protein